jgi:hypothetical protein
MIKRDEPEVRDFYVWPAGLAQVAPRNRFLSPKDQNATGQSMEAALSI